MAAIALVIVQTVTVVQTVALGRMLGPPSRSEPCWSRWVSPWWCCCSARNGALPRLLV